MEGAGAYNRNSRLQAAGASLAYPLFEKAAEEIPLKEKDQPIIIADYGSSQGKNSLTPVGLAVKSLRKRVGRNRTILVFHVDLPSNDFTSLFEVVDSDPDSYVVNEPNVVPCAIGRSFYKDVFPPASVDLAWSSFATQFLSRVPAHIPGHFSASAAEGEVRAAFRRQSDQDWETFLTLRARELRPGARLVVVQPAFDDNGRTGIEKLFDHANEVVGEMADAGVITEDERTSMVIGAFLRRKEDLLAPFRKDGSFQNLRVDNSEVTSRPDPAWAAYQEDGKAETLAAARALLLRTTIAPTLATALTCMPGDERYRTFMSQFEARLRLRAAAHPAPLDSLISTMVLVKGYTT
jgi:hypothetical protein